MSRRHLTAYAIISALLSILAAGDSYKVKAGAPLNITATKTGIIGTLSDTDGHTGSIDGVTITANRAYLLNVTLNGDPSAACNPAQFQGTASIVPSNLKLLIFTGSGIDFDCSQQ